MSRAFASGVLLLGVLVLFGGVPEGGGPPVPGAGFPARGAGSALGLALAGVMCLATGASRSVRRLGQAAAGALLALALAHLAPWPELRLEALLRGVPAAGASARMPLAAACGFVALALARLLLDRRGNELRLFGLVLSAASLVASAAIGVAYADWAMGGETLPMLFSMAPGTALGTALAACALIAASVRQAFDARVTRSRLTVLASSGLAAAFACLAWSYITWTDYTGTREEAASWTQNLVRVLDEQVRRSLDTPALMLRQVEGEIARHDLARVARSRETWESLRTLAARLPQIHSIAILDREGELVLLSQQFPSPDGNLAFREYFQAHVSGAEVHLGRILMSRLSDKLIFTYSRRLSDAQGRFAGVLVATMDVGYYRHFFESLDLPEGSVLGLLTTGGRFLVRQPMSPAALDADLSGWPLFKQHSRHSERGTFAGPSPIDGRMRLLSFQRADDLGFLVMASLDMAKVTAAFERRTVGTLSILVLVLGGLGASALLQWRTIGREEAQQAFAASVLDSVANHIAILDREGRILRTNAAWNRFGAENGAADPRGFVGANYFDICRAVAPPEAEEAARVAAGIAAVMRGELAEFTHQYRCDSPERARWFNLRATPLAGERGLVVVSHENISAMKQAEEAVRLLAQTDPLTGLANRRAFLEVAERECVRAQRHGVEMSVLALDLDHFKQINDSRGHEAGDKVLVTVAAILQAACRAGDLVARFGGEEFVILLPHTALDGALVLAERIRAGVESVRILEAESDGLRITVSGGIAQYAPGREDLPALLARADAALYEAKRAGRNRIRPAEEPPAPGRVTSRDRAVVT